MKSIEIFGYCVLAAGVISSGCSTKPTASNARNIVEEQILEQAGPLVQLIDFKTTNAQESEVMGVKIYAIEYKAEIEFRSDCYWGGPFGGFEVITDKPTPFNTYLFVGKKRAHKGQRETVPGKIQFEQTKKGWRGPDGRIY